MIFSLFKQKYLTYVYFLSLISMVLGVVACSPQHKQTSQSTTNPVNQSSAQEATRGQKPSPTKKTTREQNDSPETIYKLDMEFS